MKKIVLMICTLVLGHTLIASGIKIGLSSDPPTYKQYSKGMNLGVQVGGEPTYKHYSESTKVGVQVGDPEIYQAMLPLVFKDYNELTPIDKEAVKYGVMLGFLLSTIAGDNSDDLNYSGKLMLGVYATIALTTLITVMPQLYYNGAGAAVDGNLNQKFSLGYLTLPILVLYSLNPKLMVGLGPFLGILLSAKDKGDAFNEDIKEFVSGVDLGLKLAVFYQATAYLQFSLAFSRGFANVQDRANFKQFNQAIMLTAFYNLNHVLSR